MDDDKSWIEQTHQITRVTVQEQIKLIEIVQRIKQSLASSQGSFIYTYVQMQKNSKMISEFRKERNTKISTSFLNVQEILFSDSYSPLGSAKYNLISPDF